MTKRYLLVSLGWLFIALGVIGIFLPVVPTTPFILVAAWAFSQSSERFHNWLTSHSRLGPVVRAWQEDKSLPRQTRNRIIFLTWLSLTCSSVLIGITAFWWPAAGFAVLGCTITLYLLRIPVLEDGDYAIAACPEEAENA